MLLDEQEQASLEIPDCAKKYPRIQEKLLTLTFLVLCMLLDQLYSISPLLLYECSCTSSL